ncbi:MAG: hypothetical protein N2449_06050 [Bacteroidales bacterium]|nr:hypothetical protein [Bacteroidales bacterium]
MKPLIFTIFLLIIIFVTIHCSKERIEPKDNLNDYENIDSYFDSKKQPEQEFVIDTNGNCPVVGMQGTKFCPIKTHLMFPNGDSVYYPFIVKLVELYTPKDMLYYKLSNESNNSLLTTVGIIRIRAYKNGQELMLRPGKTWPIEMPAQQKLANMKIYYGYEQSGNINWVNNPTGNFDTTTYGYLAQIARLGWVSNSKPALNNPTNVTYNFTSTTDNLQNIATFLYLPTLKSLVKVNNQICQIVPSGQFVKSVLIGKRQNQLYHYYLQGIANSNTTVSITMSAISDANLTAILDTL